MLIIIKSIRDIVVL